MAVPTEIRWERLTDEGYIRYYEARVINDLLGDWTIVKSWGRKGSSMGGVDIMMVDDKDEAIAKIRGLALHRRKHHYEVVRCDGDIDALLMANASSIRLQAPAASVIKTEIPASPVVVVTRSGRRMPTPRTKETPASQGFGESIRRGDVRRGRARAS